MSQVFHSEVCLICRGRIELGPLDIRSVGDDKPLCRVCAGKLPAHRIVIRKRGLTPTEFPVITDFDSATRLDEYGFSDH